MTVVKRSSGLACLVLSCTLPVVVATSGVEAAEPDPGSILIEQFGPYWEGGRIPVSPVREGGADGDISVRYTSVAQDGFATPGVDFEPVDVTLEWADGEMSTSRTFFIETFRDGDYEGGAERILLAVAAEGGVETPTEVTVVISDRKFVTLEPARVLDTRAGEPTVDGEAAGAGPIGAGETIEIPITGRAGVPEGAAGIAVNVTAVEPSDRGFVRLSPCTGDVPEASTLNYAAGATTGNGAVVALGPTGSVCAFSRVATDLTIDLTGFVPTGGPLQIAAPTRLLDTRAGTATVDGLAVGEGPVVGGTVRRLPVAGRAGVPADATALFVNVTAVDPAAQGHITVFDCDDDRPLVSNLNHTAGRTTGNGALSGLAVDGDVCIFSRSSTDVVIDLNGWSTSADDPIPRAPYRLLDTRGGGDAYDGGGRLRAGEILEITPFELPSLDIWFGWSNYLNVTVVDPAAAGNVRVYPCGGAPPVTSTVNFGAGEVRSNNAIVRVGGERFCVWGRVDTDLVIDLFGAWESADGE